MPKKRTEKTDIKEIFAANLKENRRKKGLTQEKLAETADISLRYIAMLELGKSFPSGEMLEKLAKALEIQAFQLFYPLATLDGALLHLEQSILTKIDKIVDATSKQSASDNSQEELQQLRQDIVQDINNALDDKLQQSIVFNIENVVKMSVKQAVASELKNLIKK